MECYWENRLPCRIFLIVCLLKFSPAMSYIIHISDDSNPENVLFNSSIKYGWNYRLNNDLVERDPSRYYLSPLNSLLSVDPVLGNVSFTYSPKCSHFSPNCFTRFVEANVESYIIVIPLTVCKDKCNEGVAESPDFHIYKSIAQVVIHPQIETANCLTFMQSVLNISTFLPASVLSCDIKYGIPSLKDLLINTDGLIIAKQSKCFSSKKRLSFVDVPINVNCSLTSNYNYTLKIVFKINNNSIDLKKLFSHTKTDHRFKRDTRNRDIYFPNSLYTVNVLENIDAGYIVTTMKATDPINTHLKYAMLAVLDSRSQNMFSINSNTGIVTTTVKLDREYIDVHYFRVTAANSGNPAKTATTTLQVNVEDVNDYAPVFEKAKYEAEIRESVSIGTTVVTVRATDKDKGSNAEIVYSILDPGGTNEAFRIDSKSGIVTTRQSLDRETFKSYNLVIQASDQASIADRKSATTELEVHVQDENDNYPQFSQRSYSLDIPEDLNWTLSPVIANITASDEDDGSNAMVRYSIIGGNTQGRFNINTITGALSVIAPLDYETLRSYRLIIRAQDGGSPAKSNTTVVQINVLDVNDNDPRFLSPVFRETVSEGIHVGSSIVRVAAFDSDNGINSEISYAIKQTSDGFPFAIDKKTAWITTIAPLDRETAASYEFVVEACDQGSPPRSSSASVLITVQDINDNSPIFENKIYNASISEDALPGTPVISIIAVDKDENPRVNYQIVGGNLKTKFNIITQMGHGLISVAQPLNFKQDQNFLLNVTAVDEGGKYDWTNVYISVLDVNTHRPVFQKSSYTVNIPENTLVGTTVVVVQATDEDSGENARITYSMDKITEFQINPNTGAISVNQPLDREKLPGYTISVTAQDNGKPPLSDTTDVEIIIVDVNDNSPLFSESSYTTHIKEDIPKGSSVLQISATDADQGLNGRVRYTFSGGNNGNGAFTIDPTSGIIRTDQALDRETVSKYDLIAYAIDRGTPELSTSVLIKVELEDINDNPPRFDSDTLDFHIAENSPLGSTVGEIQAHDPDIGNNADIEYSIVGGEDADSFALVTRLGEPALLTTLIELDYEASKKVYHLIVRASSPPLRNDAVINVHIQDVNDNAPLLKDFRIIFNNFKNHFPFGDIGRIPAIDPDVNDTLNYRFISGNNANLLILNSNNGQIQLSSSLNTNVPIQALMEVSVTDGINEVTAKCTLSVLLVTDDMLFNSVTVRLNEMLKRAFLTPLLFDYFVDGLAAIIPCPKENIFVFNVQDDTDVKANILNVSFSAKRSGEDDVYFTTQYLRERVYLNRATLARIATVQILPFDDNLCVREPCLNFEHCLSVLKFGNATGFISSDSILFRPIYPVNTFACRCPRGFTGMKEHYLCDTELNLCYSNPCMNGSCIRTEGAYTCVCKEGFTGQHCEVNVEENDCSIDVCRGTSQCAKLIKGGFICENCTKNIFYNMFCEMSARSFSRGSFLTFPSLQHRHRFHISLSFATRDSNALLLYNGRFNERHDFIALEIIDSQIQFSFSLGANITRVSPFLESGVSDGKWHSVVVNYFNRSATVSVDNCDTEVSLSFRHHINNYSCAAREKQVLEARCKDMTATCHRFLDLTGPLQLGGLPSLPTDFRIQNKDFLGCIANLTIDHRFIDLNSFVADNGTSVGCFFKEQFCASHPCWNGGTCRETWGSFLCECLPGYGGKDCSKSIDSPRRFTGNSYIMFNPNLRPIQLPWYTSISYRTHQPSGLMMSVKLGPNDFANIELIDGFIRYHLSKIAIDFNATKTNDGMWHNIEIRWTMNQVKLSLDYGHYELLANLQDKVSGLFVGKVTVGGLEEETLGSRPVVKNGFKGCLQDIRVGSSQNPLSRPSMEQGVEEGCLALFPCDKQTCPQNSVCVSGWDNYTCTCLPGYVSGHCIDVCDLNPCKHKGKCQHSTLSNKGYECACDELHNGEYCENTLDQPCPTSWWGYPVCGPCQCQVVKGYDSDCNKTTGFCSCKENHYQLEGNEICYECNCDSIGSYNVKCNAMTGQCPCRLGVVGRRCDSCSNMFAEITLRGCEVVYEACPKSFASGIWWDRTYFDVVNVKQCPIGSKGNASRRCDQDGWQEPNLFNCTSHSFLELNDTLYALIAKHLTLNPFVMAKLSMDIHNVTNVTNMHGNDIFIIYKLLSLMLDYENKQAGLNLTHRRDKDFIQNLVQSFSNILRLEYKKLWMFIHKRYGGVMELMFKFHQYGITLAHNQGDTYTRPFEAISENIVFGLDTIDKNGSPFIILPKYNNYMQNEKMGDKSTSVILPLSDYVPQNGHPLVVSFAIYRTLGDLLTKNYDMSVRIRDVDTAINSAVLTLTVHDRNVSIWKKKVTIQFKLNENSNFTGPQCVFWQITSSHNHEGKWSTQGCQVSGRNETHLNCSCSHLTNFAVLMDLSDSEYQEYQTLTTKIVTYTGFSVSLLALFLSFLIFLCLRGLKSNCNSIHTNLVLCIFFVELIYLVGMRQTKYEFACKVVAIFLHFFFVCSFSWMLIEAVHLYRMLTEMRDIDQGQMRLYLAIGYGCPAIIVGLAVGLKPDSYGTKEFCWLSMYDKLIWSMVGPVCFIVTLNLIVFMLGIRATFQVKESVSDVSGLKSMLRLGIAFLPILGSVWVLALLSVNENIDIIHYLFGIFTCLQGLFIFFCYCIFNKKIYFEIVRCWANCRGKKLPYDNSLSGTRTTVVSQRSALAYHNSSFDGLHRNIGISTNSTTSRSTGKTSAGGAYRSEGHIQNSSISTSNFAPPEKGLKYINNSNLFHNKPVDDPDTGEVNHKAADSDSESELSIDGASLDLASSHSSDEEDYDNPNHWEVKLNKEALASSTNRLVPPPKHWPGEVSTISVSSNHDTMSHGRSAPLWSYSESRPINTIHSKELNIPERADSLPKSSRENSSIRETSPEKGSVKSLMSQNILST